MMNITACLYFVIVISVIVFASQTSAQRKKKSDKINKIGFILISIPIIYLRFAVDTNSLSDLPHYEIVYAELDNLKLYEIFSADLDVRIELGFRLFMKLCTYISSDIHFFLFVNGLLTQIILYKLFNKYSDYFFVSVIIYYLMMFCPSIYILRQYLAILIVYTSFTSIIDRNLKHFTLYTLLATCIHNTALVIIPIYYLCNIKSEKNYILALMSAAAILFSSFKTIFLYIGTNIFVGYENYLGTNKYIGSNYTDCLIILCFVIVYFLYAKKNIFNNRLDKLLFSCMFVGFGISLGGVGLPLVGRLALYLYSVIIFVVPRTMKYIKNPVIRYSFIIIVTLLIYKAFFTDDCIQEYRFYKYLFL